MIYDKSYATHKFELIKTCTYVDTSLAIYHERNLAILQKDIFETVKVPKFEFERKDNVINCCIEFINGDQLNQFTRQRYAKTVYQGLVLRCDSFDNQYSFKDFSPNNFIVCKATGDLYYVDLEAYDVFALDERISYFFDRHGWKYK